MYAGALRLKELIWKWNRDYSRKILICAINRRKSKNGTIQYNREYTYCELCGQKAHIRTHLYCTTWLATQPWHGWPLPVARPVPCPLRPGPCTFVDVETLSSNSRMRLIVKEGYNAEGELQWITED